MIICRGGHCLSAKISCVFYADAHCAPLRMKGNYFMIEKIYTIPVNEAFDLYSGCPICSLYKKLEDIELDAILGAAMMEPDIRIETNKKGFCGKHFDIMFNMKNRLGLALMIESHLSHNIVKTLKTRVFGLV